MTDPAVEVVKNEPDRFHSAPFPPAFYHQIELERPLAERATRLIEGGLRLAMRTPLQEILDTLRECRILRSEAEHFIMPLVIQVLTPLYMKLSSIVRSKDEVDREVKKRTGQGRSVTLEIDSATVYACSADTLLDHATFLKVQDGHSKSHRFRECLDLPIARLEGWIKLVTQSEKRRKENDFSAHKKIAEPTTALFRHKYDPFLQANILDEKAQSWRQMALRQVDVGLRASFFKEALKFEFAALRVAALHLKAASDYRAHLLEGLAGICLESGKLESADKVLRTIRETIPDIQDQVKRNRSIGQAAYITGRMALARGKFEDAAAKFLEAYNIWPSPYYQCSAAILYLHTTFTHKELPRPAEVEQGMVRFLVDNLPKEQQIRNEHAEQLASLAQTFKELGSVLQG